MIKRIWKPLIFISLVGVLVAALYLQVNSLERRSVGTGIGELAPDFTGTTLEGESISLNDFRGQIVLVNDFATWCGPCQAETPYLVDVYKSENGDVAIIGLNLQEDKAKVSDFKDQYSIPYPLVLDPDGEITELYNPIGLPTSWFIDSKGVVRYVHAGPMTTSMLQETLAAIREGREPDVFSELN
ncbi:MAG: TlpA disulfide reductase family protein [Anaerolineales bacterium]|jgi:peroxiredoxin